VSTSASRILEDVRIGVRLKMSALWIAMLFLFAYGDIFGLYQPGQIEEVSGGEISGIKITQIFLFGISVYIAIASVMVFLSLVLRPRVNRWTNIVLPILYIISIVASVIGETWAVFLLLEHRGKRPPDADHLVRMDVAHKGRNRRPDRAMTPG
jgi:formate-dependent nitrite reductase membrane component NrfD